MIKSPLFYEMIAFFVFASGAVAYFIVWRTEKLKFRDKKAEAFVNYENSLRLFSEEPESEMAQEVCFIFGHLYYQHHLPDFKTPNDLDLYYFWFENLDPTLLRETWIIADMQRSLEQKYQPEDSLAA